MAATRNVVLRAGTAPGKASWLRSNSSGLRLNGGWRYLVPTEIPKSRRRYMGSWKTASMFEGTSLAGFHRGNLRPRRTWFHSAATLAMLHRQALTVERWEDPKNNRERD